MLVSESISVLGSSVSTYSDQAEKVEIEKKLREISNDYAGVIVSVSGKIPVGGNLHFPDSDEMWGFLKDHYGGSSSSKGYGPCYPVRLTGYVVPGCVEDGIGMLWENSSVVAVARFFLDKFSNKFVIFRHFSSGNFIFGTFLI